MKVYVVYRDHWMRDIDSDGDYLVDIFSSYKKAKEYILEEYPDAVLDYKCDNYESYLVFEDEYERITYRIHEWEVK